MRYDVQFFQVKEFWCPCCHRGVVAAALACTLDLIRRIWDGPIKVNSGWRCPEHNGEVGGSESSRHLIGCAADITPLHGKALLPAFKSLVQHVGRQPGWEVIEYPWGMHIAVPRTEAGNLWTGGACEILIK